MTEKQEKDFLVSSENCSFNTSRENVESYLIDYLLDEEEFQERYPFVCLEPLGYNQGIIYVPYAGEFTGENPEVGYSKIPRCYGLMADNALEATGITRVRRSPQLGFRGQGTLVGVIDTGIDVDNPLFIYEDGTSKVVYFWNQEEEGIPPDGYSFGREWGREELNRALKEEPSMLPGDDNGHGTFLAALAAGREDVETGYSGAAPDSELIIVKLRQAKAYLRDFYSIEEGVWACQEDDIMLAVRYVAETAARLQRPVSICLGLGSNMGGHGGRGNLERYLSALSLIPGISFHIAAGNEGISGHHYHGSLENGESEQEVEWNVSERETGFVMELWGEGPSVFTVGFLSPGGERVDRIQLKLNESRTIRFFPEGTELRIRSFVGETISGEQVLRMNFRRPAAGVWKMFVYADGDGERDFDIWMPISNFLKEETFFLNPSSEDTVTSPGDAFYGITYTPFDVSTDSLYVRAGRGYTRDGRIKPDLAAPGVAVSVPGAGDIKITKSGSSAAAAFGAGIGVLLQEWAFVNQNDIALNGQNMRFYLIQGAVRPGAGSYPNRDWGYGIVNAYEAFLSLRR